MTTAFADIAIGAKFVYDGDTFVKTDTNIGWELRQGRRYKEWAFNPDDMCKVKE